MSFSFDQLKKETDNYRETFAEYFSINPQKEISNATDKAVKAEKKKNKKSQSKSKPQKE